MKKLIFLVFVFFNINTFSCKNPGFHSYFEQFFIYSGSTRQYEDSIKFNKELETRKNLLILYEPEEPTEYYISKGEHLRGMINFWYRRDIKVGQPNDTYILMRNYFINDFFTFAKEHNAKIVVDEKYLFLDAKYDLLIEEYIRVTKIKYEKYMSKEFREPYLKGEDKERVMKEFDEDAKEIKRRVEEAKVDLDLDYKDLWKIRFEGKLIADFWEQRENPGDDVPKKYYGEQ